MIKKNLVLIFLLGMLYGNLQAQEVFAKGDKVIQAGVGIGSYLGGSGYTTNIPPISITYEQSVVDKLLGGKSSIGVGGYLAYASDKLGEDDFSIDFNHYIVGARGQFHYQFAPKFDTYTGLMLGYNIVKTKTPENSIFDGLFDTKDSEITFSAFIGARYYFTDKVSAFAELGYGIAVLQFGLAVKL